MANKAPYVIALVCYIISFILCAVGFGTGYWYIGEGDDRLFTRLGLWEACFDGYEHTSDYIGKAYYGCWWIFHKEYSYIRDWILPSWFIAVQTLMSFAIVFYIFGLILFPSAGRDGDTARRQTIVSTLVGLCFTCICISVVLFGTMMGEDRTWMPRYDMDEPGWSFGCVVVAGFLAAFSCIAMVTYTLMRKWEIAHDDYHTGASNKKMMPMMPRI